MTEPAVAAPKGAPEDSLTPAVVAREPDPAPQPPKEKSTSQLGPIVDLVAILVVGVLAYAGKVNGDYAMVLVAVLAGVRATDLISTRGGGSGGPPAAGSIAGMLLLASHFGPRAQHGYVRVPSFVHRFVRWLRVAAACAPLACCLMGCPLPPADGCTPLATRCSPEGVPQSCSPTQRWTSGALQRPCSERASGAVCCRTRSPYQRETHACVPAALCISEASADAGAEGGEQ